MCSRSRPPTPFASRTCPAIIHRNPFDRMIVGQALVEGLPLLTADDAVPRYDIERRRP
jgi:PIN domain nuclease of toxin-antitoxin system